MSHSTAKIKDEYTNLPVSRQMKWQLRHREKAQTLKRKYSNIPQWTGPVKIDGDTITFEQLKAILRVSRSTIQRLIKSGKITGIKKNGRYFFERRVVKDLLNEV